MSVKLNTDLDGRPINSGPVYHTKGISVILHHIMLPCLSKIEHILKDSFDFVNKVDIDCDPNTKLVSWDIKSLYTNIKHELFHDAVSYWIDKYHDDLPLFARFSKQFILEGLRIILKFNFFYYNGEFYHQIKGTAMGTTFAVVGSNLVVAYQEVKLFDILPQLFPRDFVDFIIRNYFRFLDDVFHKWLACFDINIFSKILNEMDPDLKFIMENISTSSNFLDINLEINENYQLQFDIYYKPTNAFGYLRYTSCHPAHTRKNIAISLAKRIVRIVSENRTMRVEELCNHLNNRDHPPEIISDAMKKVFTPQRKPRNEDIMTFTYTYNPHHKFNKKLIKDSLKNIYSENMKKVFGNCDVILATRQPSNLKKILTKARFDMYPPPKPLRIVGLFPCNNCTYCKRGYIIQTSEFTLKRNGKTIKWTYNRFFNCNSMNILYVIKTKHDDDYYLGKTKNTKTRISKHISDVKHPENSKCKKCTEHLRYASE